MTKTNNPKVIKSKNQNYSSSIQEWVEMGLDPATYGSRRTIISTDWQNRQD
jgi:hypothetical protein